jgi:hypothetical protein
MDSVRVDRVKSRSLRVWDLYLNFFFIGPCQAAGGTPPALIARLASQNFLKLWHRTFVPGQRGALRLEAWLSVC